MCILSIKDVAIIHFCTNGPVVALFFEREPKKKHWRRGGRMKIQGLVHHHHLHHYHHHHDITSTSPTLAFSSTFHDIDKTHFLKTGNQYQRQMLRICTKPATLGGLITNSKRLSTITAAALQPSQPLDLTEDNIRQVLADAREEFGHLFDASIGMTGQVDLAELDGPFVKISLKGRFWHERSVVLARLANYMKQRIPEILEVDIEDEKQLDDSPANF